MANPTTNFGWVMPTSTDLVTDLPADFNVFGQGVDTTMADLKGGTTGQILSKATNTDMDFVWIANDQGDITGVTATSPLTGGGTSGAITVGIQDATTSVKGAVQLSDSTSTTSSVLASTPTATKSAYDLAAAAVPKSTVTTAGDVIYATGSSAVTRLGIGTAGQVLTVNGGATAPSWATPTSGGMTLLSTTTLTSTATTISSISQSYTDLYFVITNAYLSIDEYIKLQFNGDTTAGNHLSTGTRLRSTGASSVIDGTTELSTSGPDNQAKPNLITGIIRNYTSSTYHYCQTNASLFCDALNFALSVGQISYFGTSAITSLKFYATAGTFSAGTVYLYGVK